MSDFESRDRCFKLIVRGRPVAGEPQPGDMRWRLEMLNDPADTMTLLLGPGYFMQCSGSGEEGFRVEYCQGGEDQHFQAAEASIDLDLATDLFVSYLQQDQRWLNLVRWSPYAKLAGQRARRRFRLVEREGDRLIINKRWCLMTVGILISLIGAGSFFFLREVTHLYMSWVPGSILAVGFVFLLLSSMTED